MDQILLLCGHILSYDTYVLSHKKSNNDFMSSEQANNIWLKQKLQIGFDVKL